MLLGGLEFFLVPAILGAISATALIVLAIITFAAVFEVAAGRYNSGQEVAVVDPNATEELRKVAEKYSTKKHKKFLVDKTTGKPYLIESDEIDNDIDDEEYFTIKVA